ncbi:hypothetical protein J1G40_01985 [Muriicola sp. Z0-33]|nr:hypothetical protein [Muriicola sp. Z0-33]
MKRIQLFEFEDFNWFPDWLRTCMTNLIVLLQRMLGTSEVLAKLIANVLKNQGISQITDLGSGSGGVMPDVLQILKEDSELNEVRLVMTDLYPNASILKKFNENKDDSISYDPSSVDATNFSSAPEGLKTMVNSFHHMPPDKARKILASAQEHKQPLLIYELGDNKLPVLLWWFLLPVSLIILMIMVLFMTPFVKPLTWQQLVFTYLIPIIPVCYAWDGQASLPRIYSLKDMEILLSELNPQNYVWTKGYAKKNSKKQGIYVMGLPK